MSENVTYGADGSGDPAFSEIAHTADCALRIRGKDFAGLLQNAALGLYSLIGASKKEKAGGNLIEKQISLDAQDAESLLVEWLSELAYWVETTLFIGTEIDFIDVSGKHLTASVRGWEAQRIERLIKAVTYHNLQIRQTKTGLEATVVFDV
jgi:SHS2 domain-containing protein